MTSPNRQPPVLALNSGSSSLKFGLYRVGRTQTEMLLSGTAESIGEAEGSFHARDGCGHTIVREVIALRSQQDAIVRIGTALADTKMPPPVAIGHRIVHGGPKLRQHCRIDDSVLQQLEAATAFAPLHIPPALAVIRFTSEHFPAIPQVACFDHTKGHESRSVQILGDRENPSNVREPGVKSVNRSCISFRTTCRTAS